MAVVTRFGARRVMPVRAALEWAFGVEHANLDFAEAQGDNVRPGVSPLWVVMQRGQLGCSIDGGGHSLPAHDADIIASAVAALPAGLGGRGMAVRMAELARAGAVPDWGAGLRPQCLPKAWKGENQFGRVATTELKEVLKLTHRGRVREFPVYFCPITFTTTAERISAARRGYLAWIDALGHVAMCLRGQGVLDTIAITAELPVMAPWAVAAGRKVGVA